MRIAATPQTALIGASIFFVLLVLVLPRLAAAQAGQSERGVPYLTLRDRLADTSEDGFYGDDRSSLKAGRCIIDQISLDFMSSAADIAPFLIPEEILSVNRVEETSADELLSKFKTNETDAPLLYIHGYYINFEKGCRRATVIKENARLENRFLWFSWPSTGSLVNYARDEVNLYWSVPNIASIIAQLYDEFGSGKVDLAGHSLGARGLTLALSEIAVTHPELRFGDVVLVAPDIDFEIFRQLLPRIRPLTQSITIYTSASDRALAVSQQLHGYPRLGESGNDVSSLTGVEVIDASELQVKSTNGHLYHIYNEEMGEDLDQLLNGGKLAAERRGLAHVGGNSWSLLPAK